MWFKLLIFLNALTLSENELKKIGEQIWENEAHKSVEKLLFWNAKEAFPSLGIGHFIWYAEINQAAFEETFPKLVEFLIAHEAKIPQWLRDDTHCPWKSREAFLSSKNEPRMQELHALLIKTIDLQTLFMYERFKETEKQLLQASKNPARVSTLLQQLCKSSKGLYALIDYTNFKGTGISSKERYKNQGWGLLQVLEMVNEKEEDCVAEFVVAAKTALKNRVANAPSEKQEQQWLSGWFKRLDTYLEFNPNR